MWPALDYAQWKDTLDTLHMWTQVVGKSRMELAPHENHFWEVALYVTARGLTSSSIPLPDGNLDVEFDFVEHVLRIRKSTGGSRTLPLHPQSVAEFYADYMRGLHDLDVACTIWPVPVEVPEAIPFAEDTQHHAYDPEAAHRFWQVLLRIDNVFKRFRARFMGKQSPVHFWWGSFDLAVARFNGAKAPPRPNDPKFMQEAYSHEEMSFGWWPGNGGFGQPAFYAYMAPAAKGFSEQSVRPSAAYYDDKLGEFLLPYEAVRTSGDPEKAILDFCQSVYEAGTRVGRWDRAALDMPVAAAAEKAS